MTLVKGDSQQAYGLTTNEYRAHHTLREFEQDFADIKDDEQFLAKDPSVLSFSLKSAEIYAWRDPGWFALLNGPSFFYRKEDGHWRFTGNTELYLD